MKKDKLVFVFVCRMSKPTRSKQIGFPLPHDSESQLNQQQQSFVLPSVSGKKVKVAGQLLIGQL